MKRARLPVIVAALSSILINACSDNKSVEPSKPQAPTMSTAAVSAVTHTTAQCGGTVTSDGGAGVTARGVCWSLTSTLTTDDSTTSDGTGTGSYTSSLTNLNPGTKYYVRAYATNSAGTGYGAVDSFTTESLVQIKSTFDTDDEGWVEVGEGVLYYRSDQGNPGGYVEFEDWEAGAGGFRAPDKFIGDLSAYSQGTLSFDLKNTVNNGGGALTTYGLIRISSGPLYAEKNAVPYPSYLTEWTTFSIPMTADVWGVTPTQWDSILSNITEVLIYMDPQGNFDDRSGLDNFAITASMNLVAGSTEGRDK